MALWIALASALRVLCSPAPVGRTDAELPLDAQLIGRWGEEEQLLTLGELLEQATGASRRRRDPQHRYSDRRPDERPDGSPARLGVSGWRPHTGWRLSYRRRIGGGRCMSTGAVLHTRAPTDGVPATRATTTAR